MCHAVGRFAFGDHGACQLRFKRSKELFFEGSETTSRQGPSRSNLFTTIMHKNPFLVGIACLLGTCLASVSAETALDRELSERLEARLPGFFGPQTAPSDASDVSRLVVDWDPAAAAVVSFPVGTVLKSPRDFAFYYSFFDAATRHVDVVVMLGTQESSYTGLFLRRLRDAGLGEVALDRIHFVTSQSNEFWAGDYGPKFARGKSVDLLLLDAIYRPLGGDEDAIEAEAFEVGQGDMAEDQRLLSEFRLQRRRSDVSPLFLSRFIRQHYQFECEVVRPPLHLKGGNFIAASTGSAIVAESTLLANGGRLSELKDVFELYYGVSEIVVLDALPHGGGSTLSSLVQVPAENTILLAEAPRLPENASPSRRRKALELMEVVDGNFKQLQRRLPAAKVYRLPMPPIVAQDSSKVARKARAQVFARVCEEIGIDHLKFTRLATGDPQREDVQRLVYDRLQSRFGKRFDADSPAALDVVFKHYLDLSWQDLLAKYDGEGVVYRSYTSGVQLGRKGKGSVWLLPRYRARVGESVEDFALMEKEVENVYRSIDPEGMFYWLEADVLAERHGSLSRAVGVVPW